MNSSRMTLLATALLLASGASSHAAQTLATPPAASDFLPGWALNCAGTNASTTQPLTLSVEAVDYSGATVSSTSPYTLQPGEAFENLIPFGVGAVGCVFHVSGGNPKYLRAAANYHDSLKDAMIVPAR